jgi:hypothetical protein
VRWTWTTSRLPLTPADRDRLAPDLRQLGADESLLTVLDATVAAGGVWTRPTWLLARAPDGRLLGAVLVVLCRDYGPSFFGPEAGAAALLRAGPPLWYWDRTSLGADGVSMPGLVAPGVAREELVARALRRLSRRTVGALVDDAAPVVPHVRHAFIGSCSVAVPQDPRTELLAAHRNLGRKLRRFAGRGGTVRRLDGPMPADLGARLQAGYALTRPVNPPFLERYPHILAAHWSLRGAGLVHLVAWLDGQPVGYHTFWRAGRHLSMLSGVVARPSGGSVHAYENLLVASLELARSLGCDRMDSGLGVNAAKVSLLGRVPNALHLVSRLPPVRAGVRLLLPRSRLSHENLGRVTGVPLPAA